MHGCMGRQVHACMGRCVHGCMRRQVHAKAWGGRTGACTHQGDRCIVACMGEAYVRKKCGDGRFSVRSGRGGRGQARVKGNPPTSVSWDALHSSHPALPLLQGMLHTYGVEAARATIMKEASGVFNAYGIGVDPRHLCLIAGVDVRAFWGRECLIAGEWDVRAFVGEGWREGARFDICGADAFASAYNRVVLTRSVDWCRLEKGEGGYMS
eukprot:365111-Chlamydomonas_euryale.AAC.5